MFADPTTQRVSARSIAENWSALQPGWHLPSVETKTGITARGLLALVPRPQEEPLVVGDKPTPPPEQQPSYTIAEAMLALKHPADTGIVLDDGGINVDAALDMLLAYGESDANHGLVVPIDHWMLARVRRAGLVRPSAQL